MTGRLALEDDLPHIAKLHAQSWTNAYRGVVPDDFIAGIKPSVEGWRSTFTQFPDNLSVAEHDGAVVGFSCAGPVVDAATNGPYQFQVYGLHVRAAQRGRGIGAALLHAAFARAVAENVPTVILWTFRDLTRTRHFYEREGGTLVKTSVWRPDDLAIAEVAYGWDLAKQRA